MTGLTSSAANMDAVPLLGSKERREVPWWAAKGTGDTATTVEVQLPERLVERLWELQAEFGIAVSDLVASYVERGVEDAWTRRSRSLADIEDHSRIKGWMPSGTPILRAGPGD
jgi:hypothetical protein